MIYTGLYTSNDERSVDFNFFLFVLIVSASLCLDSFYNNSPPTMFAFDPMTSFDIFRFNEGSQFFSNTSLALSSNRKSGVPPTIPDISRHSCLEYCSFLQQTIDQIRFPIKEIFGLAHFRSIFYHGFRRL